MKSRIALTMIASLSLLGCAKIRVSDSLKAEKLTNTSVFGLDTPVPPNAGGNDTPTPPKTGGNDFPTLPTIPGGNDFPTIPAIPGGNDFPFPTQSGNDLPLPRDTGNDPTVGSAYVSVMLMCPNAVHKGIKTVADITEDLKLVFVQNGKSACEVHGVRDQMVKNHRIDVSSCDSVVNKPPAGAMAVPVTTMFLVPESVSSDYQKYDLTQSALGTMYSSGAMLWVEYTYDNDKTNAANCDMRGDPLVVQLGSAKPQPIQLTAPEDGVYFDLLGQRVNHQKVKTAWFANSSTENYFLVLPDENGEVHGIDELFGDSTKGPDHRYAKQGFAALAKYDLNHDHLIDGEDAVFQKLALWKDANLDGVAQPEEIFSLDSKGVVAIDLKFDRRYREVDSHGNMIKFKSVVIMNDQSYGLIFDLWLRFIAQ